MLLAAGIAFDVIIPSVDEEAVKAELLAENAAPRAIADALAELKALRVSTRYPDALVIGADQVLVCEDRLFNKAADKVEAGKTLRALKGRKHQLVSAVVLARNMRPIWRHVESADLLMRDFSNAFLESYLSEEREAVLECVGCYRIEGRGVQLFDGIAGDQFTIRGLPLLPLLAALRLNGALVR